MRAVIDTNVLVSGLFWHGPPHILLEHVRNGALDLISSPALSALLNERASLSPEMALRIEKAFGISMDTLMRMQTSYDVAMLRKQKPAIQVRRYVPA